MLPLIPYNGILRPALMTAFLLLTALFVNGARKGRVRSRAAAAFFVYIVLLAYLTFLSRKPGAAYSYRLTLFTALRQAFAVGTDTGRLVLINPEALEGIVLNLLMFIPLGQLLPVLFPKLRWGQIIGIGFLTTVCIEVGQLLTKLGMFDFDDILNNVLGTGLGLLIAKAFKKGVCSHK